MKKKFLFTLAVFVLFITATISFPSLVNADTEPYTAIIGQQLKFGESVYLNYAIYYENVPDGAETGLLVWKAPNYDPANATYANAEYMITVRNGTETVDDKLCDLIAFHEISAAEMGKDIYAVSYIKESDSKITYSTVQKYSVLQYAYNKLGYTGTATDNEDLKALLESMLAYGGSVQKYANIDTEHSVDKTFYQVKVEGGTLADGTTSGLFIEGDKVTVTATRDDFRSWFDDDDNYLSIQNSYEYTVGKSNFKLVATNVECLEYRSKGNGECYVSGIGSVTSSDVVIPTTSPSGETVVEIGSSVFKNNTTITSVTIPETVTTIGDYAFKNCTELTSIVIPDTVTTIKSGAFADCVNLSSISGFGGVTSMGGSTFARCSNLTTVDFNSGIQSLGVSCFTECESLETIELPDSITTEELELTFEDCSSLKYVKLPSGVTSLKKTFYNCVKLTEITIPDSVTEMYGTFVGCKGLTSITIPSKVTDASETFRGCTNLVNVWLPSSVTEIGLTFSNCANLESVILPADLNYMGYNNFDKCTSLTHVYYEGTEEDYAVVINASASDPYGDWNETGKLYFMSDSYEEGKLLWHYVDGEPVIWTEQVD